MNLSEAVKTRNRNAEKLMPEIVATGFVRRFVVAIARRARVMVPKPKGVSVS